MHLEGPSKGIRITLAQLPALLHDIVRDAVLGEPDMRIVGEYPGEAAFVPDLAAQAPDVVIVGVEQTEKPEDLPIVDGFFRAIPFVRLLLVARNGHSALLYELRPHRLRLGEVSREGLIAAIRGQAWDTGKGQRGH